MVSAYLQSWQRPFIVEALEFVEGDGRIAVRVRWKGTARSGGGQVESQNTHVWEFRDQRAIRFDVYDDHDEALKALRAPPGGGGGTPAG